MAKNIVIFADGTGQEGGVANNTNVYELFNIIEDRSLRQVSFYDRGLGTGWRKITGNVGGAGISKNIHECYEFLCDCYNAGDQVYLFGFSRGATTVRTLAAFVHQFGILPRSRPELIKRAYKIYKIRNKEKRLEKGKEFLKLNHTMWCRIKFLGVWDTVAALGLPIKLLDVLIDQIPFLQHSYHDLRLSKSVEFARHAVSIDDERSTFHPALWDEEKERQSKDAPLEFSTDDILDVYLIATKLKAGTDHPDPVSEKLRARFSGGTKKLIEALDSYLPGRTQRDRDAENKLKEALVGEFNEIDEPLYDKDRARLFDSMDLSKDTREIIHKNGDFRPLNRRLLEDTYVLKPALRPRVKQVWFTGMHTDVGGGYPESELAHIPLLWMIKEAMDAGLLIYPKHKVDLRPDATGKIHDSRAGLGRLYLRRARFWDRGTNQNKNPRVHESVLMRRRCEEMQYAPWILKQDYDLEPWPKRVMSGVQFDAYYIWREALWGFDGAFAMPWSRIKSVSYSQVERTIKLRIADEKDRLWETDPIEIREISSSVAEDVKAAFARYSEEAQEERQRKMLGELEKNDNAHYKGIAELQERVVALEKQIVASEGKYAQTKTETKLSEIR